MKYTCEVIIELPRDRVLELFDSTENLQKWQTGLKSFEHLEGTPGEPGAKMRLVYDMKGRTTEMVETVTARNLPDGLTFTYEAKGVWNECENKFVDNGNGGTRWVMDSEFRCKGFMALLTLLAPGMFKKQTSSEMKKFKNFAESA